MSWILLLWACVVPEKPAAPSVSPPSESAPLAEKPTEPRVVLPVVPRFDGSAGSITEVIRSRMDGVSMHPGCPVAYEGLSYLEMSHWGIDGEIHRGELIVANEFATEILQVFQRLFDAKFAIERMRLVSDYAGSDDASMAANNTSAFNCRAVTGGKAWSQHSYGNAIDLNPVTNPYVRGSLVLPPEGKRFADRTVDAPGLVRSGDVVVAAFAAIGWQWGGTWERLQDYQHFSSNGK